MLSAQGAPDMPAGGSELSRLKSRMSRRRHAVDYNYFIVSTYRRYWRRWC